MVEQVNMVERKQKAKHEKTNTRKGKALARLWEALGNLWGGLWEALGMLWKALGRRWEALGGFGDARHPSPNKTIHKNVGSTQTPNKPALLAQC